MKRGEGLSGPGSGDNPEWFKSPPPLPRVPVTRRAPVAPATAPPPASTAPPAATGPLALPDEPPTEQLPLPESESIAEPGEPGGPVAAAAPAGQPRAYWFGLAVLVVGLVAIMSSLATHVTSIVQTVLLATPLLLLGVGLERVGRGVGRASLRTLGAVVIVVAVASPVALSLSRPGSQVSTTVDEQVPAGASNGALHVTLGGGQLHVGPGAPGLVRGELLSPGTPSTEVSTSGKTAVAALAGPRQHGLLARNRGSDWDVRLGSGLPWTLKVDAGPLTADFDLRQLNVQGVDLSSGISRVALRLNQPAARVPVSLQVSTGLLDVYLPRSASCEIRVTAPVGALVQSNFGSQGLVSQGGAWRTPGESATATFVIEVRVGAGRVRIHRV
ncbi:MAG TPA: hypothetical protein VF995_01740 [Actinomycetota bacterium]